MIKHITRMETHFSALHEYSFESAADIRATAYYSPPKGATTTLGRTFRAFSASGHPDNQVA